MCSTSAGFHQIRLYAHLSRSPESVWWSSRCSDDPFSVEEEEWVPNCLFMWLKQRQHHHWLDVSEQLTQRKLWNFIVYSSGSSTQAGTDRRVRGLKMEAKTQQLHISQTTMKPGFKNTKPREPDITWLHPLISCMLNEELESLRCTNYEIIV